MCKSSSARPWDGLKPIWWNRTIHFEIMSDPNFAQTRPPPYHAVIFTSTQTDGDNGYSSKTNAAAPLAGWQCDTCASGSLCINGTVAPCAAGYSCANGAASVCPANRYCPEGISVSLACPINAHSPAGSNACTVGSRFAG